MNRQAVTRKVKQQFIKRTGYKLSPAYPRNLPPEFKAEVDECQPFTMTSVERMFALWRAVRYVVEAKIPGAFVEAGVWRGGSGLLMTRTLLALDAPDRELWLYDTFTGMAEPTAEDGALPRRTWEAMRKDTHNAWCFSPLEEVRATMARCAYPPELVHLVAGKVEDTIPDQAPDEIALLRLDTDWYASTRHELEHLWPRLSPGGVLIIDDYGHWEGARRAVDEFFAVHGPVLLNRIDSTGVTVQKS